MRVGFGYDVHKYTPSRPLILGGAKIPYKLGLLGHSDADVLLHAIMDSILGALGLGDIGIHFPDTDERYRNIKSTCLLQQVYAILINKGYRIGNIDATIVAQQPKLSPYIPKMQEMIALILRTDSRNINIKATTEEKLGFTGTLEGIKSYAVCCIERINNEDF